MLIRVKGYNTGAKEYLEQGIKAGREFSRDELDERVMLDGDLDITCMVYDSIEDKGQDRYISITLAFREDHIPVETLLAVTQETKQFLMHAYKKDEFNFYAEAHLPKIKMIKDNATEEMIERKPHVHIIIPRKNLLSGNEANPVGMHDANVKYLEAFQEYINQKYNLASPREHVRADIKDAASVLSRYKGDDFYGKNREFKQDLVKQVIERGVVTRPDFYALVAEHGETRIRNEGKDNEYIAVKLPGDAKFTNLKDTIFHDDFIVRRELKKAPLDKKVIQDRLLAWPQRAKEIKYVSKATPAFRKLYTASSPDERLRLLADRERTFYQTYGDRYGSLYAPERERDNQRSAVEAKGRGPARATTGVQDVPVSDVADHGQAGQTGGSDGAVLLPGNAHLHMGQSHTGGDSGLRPPIRAGGGRGSTGESGRRREPTALPQSTNGTTKTARAGGTPRRPGRSKSVAPPFPRNPHRIPTIADIETRSRRLFGPLKRAVESELKFHRATIKSLTVNKSASTVAAYFNRQLEQNQMAPAQRHAIRRVNKQFFDLKRTLFADSRLTREERTQLVSVLTFERLKANQQIKSTSSMSEVQFMGSAQIRQLITVEKEDPGFSFSGPTGPGPAGVRERVKQILERVSRQLDQPASKERTRELAAKDLYTKKARFSQNVHYLDKHTDKTLFVDSGKAISMRRTGITEAGVAVALQLAKERFGSTLTITGTAEFKSLVIEAAAKNGVDVHFTDKDMNQSLLARRAELEIEKEAQTISPAAAPVESQTELSPAGSSPNVVDLEVSGRAIEVHLDDPIQVESVSRELNFQVSALGDRANMLGEQLVAFSSRQNVVQLPTVSELSSEQSSVERDRVWGLAEAGKPIPPNIMSDPTRLEWFREGLAARIPMLEAGNGQAGSVDEKLLAASVALLAQVDQRRAMAVTVGPPTTISLPSTQTLEALNNKIARVTKEQSTVLELKGHAERALNKLTGAVAQHVIVQAQSVQAAEVNQAPVVVVSAQNPSELVQREAAWRQSMQMPGSTALSEADVRGSDTVMGLRGEDHAIWLVATNDKSPDAVAMIRSYMENDSYRDAFKGAIESFYAKSQNSPESIQTLDEVTDFVVPMVNEIENRKLAASVSDVGTPAPASKQPDNRKLIVGVLVDHGAAPYQNKPDNEPSYFVTVETDAGNRTLWGAGLADAMQQTQFNQGERLRIEDKGTVPVTLLLPQDDGTLLEKPGYRREWAVDLETAVKAPLAVVTATTTSDAQERLESLSADTDISDADQDWIDNHYWVDPTNPEDHPEVDFEQYADSTDVEATSIVEPGTDIASEKAQKGKSTPAPATPAQAEPEQDHGPEMD